MDTDEDDAGDTPPVEQLARAAVRAAAAARALIFSEAGT